MVAARSEIRAPHSAAEQQFIVYGVPWKTYLLLREAADRTDQHLKMTYCEGALELMSPSKAHEVGKSLVGRLLELYAFLTRTSLMGYGSTTFKRKAKKRGVEPDECYCIGRHLGDADVDCPDIVIEVIETRPILDKLHVYDGLEVREVWLVEDGAIAIHQRKAGGGYKRARRSGFLPNLDPNLIERFLGRKDHDKVTYEFAALITAGTTKAKKKPRRRSRS